MALSAGTVETGGAGRGAGRPRLDFEPLLRAKRPQRGDRRAKELASIHRTDATSTIDASRLRGRRGVTPQ
jgi:hypothetical protein